MSYTIQWGHMHAFWTRTESFPRALELFAEHHTGDCGAVITGEGYDVDCDEDGFHVVDDGLTDYEREAIEAVEAGEPLRSVLERAA